MYELQREVFEDEGYEIHVLHVRTCTCIHVCHVDVLSNVMFTLGLAMIEGLGYISHFLKLYPSSILPFVFPRHHASSTAQLAFRIEDGHIPSCSVSHHSARPNATNNCPDIFSAISGVECLA
jgi:hypothetical protein